MGAGTGQIKGLTAAEVADRRAQGLVNQVERRTSRSLGSIIRANVLTLFNAIIIVAMATVLVVGNWRDAVFGFVMILNAAIGILSEWRAKRTLDALAILDAPHATVVRDGAEQRIPFSEVVRDDVVRAGLGDQIPVDGEVLAVHAAEVDESMLTGESKPVKKGPGDAVLAGTSVVAGSVVLRATQVGDATYAAGITRQARQFALTESEIQTGVNKVLRVISVVIVPVALLVFWSQYRLLDQGGHSDWRMAVVLAVSAVVGMIPQGLVLLTSLNFAVGSATLARRGVLVQELPAVETLARVDSLCLDKTGTLTTGGIRTREIVAVDPDSEREGREVLGLLVSDRTNATAQAIADTLGLGAAPQGDEAASGGRIVAFSSARKWSAYSDGAGTWVFGAPEILLASAPTCQEADVARRTVQDHADRGHRVTCLARSAGPLVGESLPDGLVPSLVVVLEEDIRPDAADTLSYFREQGVRVRVISGDNPVTVGALAAGVGLQGPDGSAPRLCDARSLPEDLGSEQFVQAVADHDVFGRVTPEQKRAMVHALQGRGHVVAMTGDGVNDSLALKDADLGIAMGNGASATKAVAQLVLVRGQFSVLPGVVAEGRRIMANMERVSALFLAKTTYATLIAVICAVMTWQYPFLPRHFTYIDALTIGAPAFVIALAPNARRYLPGYLTRTLGLAVPSGIVLTSAALTAFAWVGVGDVAGQSAATLALMAGALWLLSITARPFSWWRVALLVAMAAGAVLGVLVPVTRDFFALSWPDGGQWAVILVIGAVACVLIEVLNRVIAPIMARRAEVAAGRRAMEGSGA